MKRHIFLLIALFISVYSFGQGEMDAYRISRNDLSGTARGQAMGGAFGALGGDVTGVLINPAGIGIYRSSEILFNAALTFDRTAALFYGTEETKGNTRFTCDNFGYVGTFPLETKSGDYSINFGFNYNLLKNFDRKYRVSGRGMGSSLTDYMSEVTWGTPHSWWGFDNFEDQFYANGRPHWLGILGWNAWLIDPHPDYSDGYISLLNDGERVDPKFEIHESGSIDAYDFTLGANLNNKLYLGATIVYTDIEYDSHVFYGENFENGGGFDLNNGYSTQGSGIQLKVGVIGKPTDALRLGVSYHSPTWYNLTDFFQGTLNPYDITDNDESMSTPNRGASYRYNFRTPDVWTISAAYVLGQAAIISLDYEYKNYGNMRFSRQHINDYDFINENDYIQEDFKGSSTIRVGGEIRFSPQLSGRLGTAWMQHPYDAGFKNGEREVMMPGTIPSYTLDGNTFYLTGGIGYRFTPQFYMDLALVFRTQQDDFYFFSPIFFDDGSRIVDSTPTTLRNNSFKTMVTLGYRF